MNVDSAANKFVRSGLFGDCPNSTKCNEIV